MSEEGVECRGEVEALERNLFREDQTPRVGLRHRVEPRREDLGDDSES